MSFPAHLLSPVTPLNYPYVPLSPGQYGLAPTTATHLTVPNGAVYAVICAEGATVRYTTDGTTTPTGSVGVALAAGSCVAIVGSLVLANFQAFSAAGTLNVEYFQ